MKPLKTFCFQGLFTGRILARNFVRGSVVEAAEGKSQRRNGENAMTQS
jgi:hypothetical protein